MPTVSSACRLCTNIHHNAPLRIVLQQAAAVDAALHALSGMCYPIHFHELQSSFGGIQEKIMREE